MTKWYVLTEVAFQSIAVVVCDGPYTPTTQCSTGNFSTKVHQGDLSGTPGVIIAITPSDLISRFQSVLVRVPDTFGIRAPLGGSEFNNIFHYIGTDAEAGPVPFTEKQTRFESAQAIYQVQLGYEPAKLPTGECDGHAVEGGACDSWVDESIDLTVRFAYGNAFVPGHSVELFLPGFTRQVFRYHNGNIQLQPNCSAAECESGGFATNNSAVSQAQWDHSREVLSLTFTQEVPANEFIIVTVPKSSGMKLPRAGVTSNQPDFTYKFFASPEVGPLGGILSPSVGAFVTRTGTSPAYTYVPSTALSVSQARAGDSTGLVVSFAHDGGFKQGGQCVEFCGTENGAPSKASVVRDVFLRETVSVLLQGFSRLGGDLEHFETDAASVRCVEGHDVISEICARALHAIWYRHRSTRFSHSLVEYLANKAVTEFLIFC